MSDQKEFVQQFARWFPRHHENSSPEPERGSASWNTIPADQRHRLVAAARLAILELETDAHSQDNSRLHFAKPGEAERGC